MLGIPHGAGVLDDERSYGAQPRDNFTRLAQSTHMRVAGGEITVWYREAGILLDCEEQVWYGLCETPSKEMRAAYHNERYADAGAWAEPQRRLDVLQGGVGLARPQPEDAADVPTARVVRVVRQGTVDQRQHRANILTQRGERQGGMRQDARVLAGYFQGSPGKINTPSIGPPRGLRSDNRISAGYSRMRPRRARARNADRVDRPQTERLRDLLADDQTIAQACR